MPGCGPSVGMRTVPSLQPFGFDTACFFLFFYSHNAPLTCASLDLPALLLQVSVNDCVIKAVALALAEVPAANAFWDAQQEAVVAAGSGGGRRRARELHLRLVAWSHRAAVMLVRLNLPCPASFAVDISIAVATEGGLITPIIKGADKKSLPQIAAEVRLVGAGL